MKTGGSLELVAREPAKDRARTPSPHLNCQRLEFIDLLKTSVHAGKAHLGDLVERYGVPDFAALVLGAPAVFLDDGREVDIRPHIGREALFTRAVLAAAYEVGILGNPGLDDLGFKVAAKNGTSWVPQTRYFMN